MENLQSLVGGFVDTLQDDLASAVARREHLVRAGDADALFRAILGDHVALPLDQLQRMCRVIVDLARIDARFVCDLPDGSALYEARVEVRL